jgi:hypothetical protein
VYIHALLLKCSNVKKGPEKVVLIAESFISEKSIILMFLRYLRYDFSEILVTQGIEGKIDLKYISWNM